MEYQNESQVAKKAEQMLQSALRTKVSTFGDHINRKPEDISIKDATVKTKMKNYGSARAGTKKTYIRSLAIKMARHGFIQHFGVDNTRTGGTRTREKPRTFTYSFKSHIMQMKAQPFINEAVERSGVVPFVMENVTKLRSEEIMFEVKKFLENN